MSKFRRLFLLLILLIVLLCIGCSSQPAEDSIGTSKPVDPAKPEPVPDPEPEVIPEPELPGAFFVMIDDHPQARPQLNLEKADIVYEIVCEGTYTRYLAGFYTIDPIKVGPIRSARYYFVQTVLPYDSLYIHVGGNMDAMDMIEDLGIKTMCDITNASGYYIRDKSRLMPHNSYITTESILKFAEKRKHSLEPLPELRVGELTDGRGITEIELIYGTEKHPHDIKWVYQPEEDRFLRYLNGEVFITASESNILADNIIIIEAPVKTVRVPVDGIQSEIDLIDSGRAVFLRNGKLYHGIWQKESAEQHFTYRLDDGRMWVYEEGNTWVQQVHSLTENSIISFIETQ